MKKVTFLVLALLFSTIAAAQDFPNAEIFAGYTYVRANAALNNPSFSANGGSGQLVLNFNRWAGFVTDIGAVHNGNISDVRLDSTFTHYMFGPRVSIRRHSRVTPFFQFLMGGVHASTSKQLDVNTLPQPENPIFIPGQGEMPPQGGPVSLRAGHSQTAFGFALGGGMDIKINKYVSFRPFSLEWYMSRLQNVRTLTDNNQQNLRYSTGFNFTFGAEEPGPPPPPPPQPAMKSCWDGTSILATDTCPLRQLALKLSGPPKDLCSGEALPLGAAAPMPDGATYQWTINGEDTSREQSLEFGATGRTPGPYEVGLTVTAPGYQDASTRTTITVLPYRPPSGSLAVSPIEIWQGEEAAVAANFSPGQCGGALGSPAISASEGVIRGNRFDSTTVPFDPTDNAEQRKTVRLSARVADERGSASAEATVVVKRQAVVVAKRLPDVIFAEASARVNNCGARLLLEELKSYAASDPGGRVVFVGHVSAKEAGSAGLDLKRALSAAAMISAGTGICSSFPADRILLSAAGAIDNGVDYQSHFCGTSTTPLSEERPGQLIRPTDSDAKYRRVEVWFVPTGGLLPASLKDPKDAATLSVAALGCQR
jgi:hypothetical protein